VHFIRWLAFLVAAPLLAHQVASMGLKTSEISVGDDPWILADRMTSTYYMYCGTRLPETTQGTADVTMYRSNDLRTWDGPHIVFTVPESGWANPRGGVWSPEVHVYRGRYYLIATLHNPDTIIDKPPDSWRVTHMRGTEIFVSESPEGPFEPVPNSADGPIPPADFMTLDGTLYVEGAIPFMVYAHQWVQLIDGTMEAIELKSDLSGTVGEPFYLFKASDAPWLGEQHRASTAPRYYVSGGPQLHKTKNGKLLMLWSSLRDDLYIQTLAYSLSGRLRGPWRQMEPILGDDRGHGMIFKRMDGTLMLVVRHPRQQPSRPELYEIEDTGDTVLVKRRFPF
jgi:glycosyl hydrolase family 43